MYDFSIYDNGTCIFKDKIKELTNRDGYGTFINYIDMNNKETLIQMKTGIAIFKEIDEHKGFGKV